MKGETEVLLMIGFFFAGAILMAYGEDISVVPYLNLLVGAISTLAAAFFGAKYAYTLQQARAEQIATKEKVSAGNIAIFELVRTFNQFYGIQKQFIDALRNDPVRHLSMKPLAANLHAMKFNFDELAFVLDTNHRDLLGQLAMFQIEVAGVLDVISQRSRLHVEVVQPAIEICERKHGEMMTIEQIEKEVGRRNTHVVLELTELLISGVDGVVESSEKYISQLNTALKSIFPNHTIIGMLPPAA